MRERYIEQQLMKKTRQRGGLCEKWNAGTSGWPDRIVLLPDGKVGFVEVKAPGEHLRPMQEKWRDKCLRLGIDYVCADSIDAFKYFMLITYNLK